ncbi:MAG: hypothetical protein ABI389_14875 [Rhodanobacter sp.]
MRDAYQFPGFRPQATAKGVFGDPKARVVTLVRRGKKQSADVAVTDNRAGMTAKCTVYATCRAVTRGFGWSWRFVAWIVEPATR